MRRNYRQWLEQQQYGANTVSTQCSHATRIEQAYGDLDAHYDTDRLDSVLASLRYSSDDSRRGKANPSRISIGGDLYKSLASFRVAVGLYRRFLDEEAGISAGTAPTLPTVANAPTAEPRERIGLERDLQKALRREIESLELGLSIIDDGVERAVGSGYVDITARDTEGRIVVIELKAGTADRAAIGQILGYMGDIALEEADMAVRGILVAHDFDPRARAAARVVPGLVLRAYSISFSFREPGDPDV